MIHFAAVVKVKKKTENNEGVVDLVTKILDSPTTLNTREIFDRKTSYASFLYLFGTCMVPAAKLKKMVCENQYEFESIISAEDEALAITILENNVAKWSAEVNKMLEIHPTNPDILRLSVFSKEEKKDLPPSKFTMGTKETSNNLRSGWNDEGKLRFFMLLKTCSEFRLDKNKYEEFKNEALFQFGSNYDERSRKRARTTSDEESDEGVQELLEKEDTLQKYYEEHFNQARFSV